MEYSKLLKNVSIIMSKTMLGCASAYPLDHGPDFLKISEDFGHAWGLQSTYTSIEPLVKKLD